ncbi:2OG-Fe(II) oxygenase [Ureibacillus endophyticus]|uniref:2OG-Fe(II) oxygenase n=1 Tax=Ureibacillus endophyticus TaxID=1978490 RepID=A0A494Z6U0_9BACL|nr:2OG-Fe(II) oxygenase [Lysinibacillus endophyticus]RKQ18026.1 2OG-Fe(II) oxygenase [Lysinibacillus endophyticus]
MTTNVAEIRSKEQTIFNFTGNKVKTEDRVIDVLAKYEEPLVVVLGSVLDGEECDRLIELSKNRLQRSKIGVEKVVSDIRTSSGSFLTDVNDEIVSKIEKRVSSIVGIPVEHAEGLHILNYKPGQEYKEHFDYFAATSKSASNNRICTVVLYLSDVEDGGETYFPKLGLKVYPKKGMAVYFEYFYNDQTLNELTLHGGAPVVTGEKWIATQWFRRKKLD